jgi:DNA-binding NtrC family response regulator
MDKILVIDDDELMRTTLRDLLEANGYPVMVASGGNQGVELFKKEPPSAILLDLRMPGMDGIETMQELKTMDSDVPIIFVTAHAEIPAAVDAIKRGAYDFIVKPPKYDRLMFTLERAIEKLHLTKELKRLTTAVDTSLESTLGRSQGMTRIIEQIRQVARTDFSVVLQGETGTGKSLVARTIHDLSERAKKPFVRVDMGVIPETLAESELFGYEKGAFTGAEKKKRGVFETAQGGTIFIDELENMPPYVQSKLLSAVEEKKIYPLGHTTPLPVEIRVIAATNKNIKQSVIEGNFREDLFFRLGEFLITIPPLRDRADDIPFLAERFLREASAELHKNVEALSEETMDLLIRYPWPGNIRELKNVIRRAVLLSEGGIITPEHIEFLIEDESMDQGAKQLMPLKELSAMALMDVEKKAIKQALEHSQGNKTKAASLLQVDYKTLLTKIKQYNIH